MVNEWNVHLARKKADDLQRRADLAREMADFAELRVSPYEGMEVKVPGRCEWFDLHQAAIAGHVRRKDGVDAGACPHGD